MRVGTPMREKYLTSKQIANHLGSSLRNIQRIALEEGWDYREVKKGKTREKRFAFSTLPTSIQARIMRSQSSELVIIEDTPMNRLALEPYNRKVLEARATALELFKRFHKEKGMRKDKALGKFVEKWEAIASPATFKILPKLSKQTMYRWEKDLMKGGTIALAPSYGKRQGITKVPQELQQLILNAYLDQNQRTARSIHKHIINKIALQELGENVGDIELAKYKRELGNQLSEKVVMRFIHNNTTKGLRDKTRGNKSQREKVQAYITRDPSTIHSNHTWVSDGHDANNYIFDDYGKVIRPVIVMWQDVRSRMIMGWDIDTTENTDLVISSLCNAVEKHGAPQFAYIDNGKAYINKRTADKVKSENRLKAYSMLGIEEKTTRPYNGKEKPIERTWGTVDNDFSKFLPGYAGKDILSKPESTAIDVKKGNILSLAEYKEAFEKQVRHYNTNLHTGMGMDGKSPAEVYIDNITTIKRVNQDTITILRLITIPDMRVVMGGGKIRCKNREYIAPELLNYVGLKVELALDPQNLNSAYVYYEGKFIAKAEGVVYADFFDSPNTQKAYKQHSRQKVVERKNNKKALEAKKSQSAILLAEKTKVLESAPLQIIEKAEKFDRYDY